MYISMATHLHEGVNFCLRKLILASLYEALGHASEDLRRAIDSFQIGGPIWLLQLWLNATFAHTLNIQIPHCTEVGAKGIRLARFTPGEDKGVSREAFEKVILHFLQM